MNDYYQQYLTTMSGVRDPQASSPDDFFPSGSPQSKATTPTPQALQGASLASPTSPNPSLSSGSKPSKARRKPSTGEAVKHRRTRSGCFTCRNRRVKCDEKRPICNRCQKGGRDCVYPDPPETKGSSAPNGRARDSKLAHGQISPESSNEGDLEPASLTKLATIQDQDEHDNSAMDPAAKRKGTQKGASQDDAGRYPSETPSLDDTKSTSPTGSTPANASFPTTPYQPSEQTIRRPSWSHMPASIQKHLDWFTDNMTHYNWCMLHDPDDFFQTILPSVAMANEPLLNAFVGFIAYLATLQNTNGRIPDFLHYYNRSVQLLLESIRSRDRHDIATLLTVLQLATIEEYLGDWINLLGHQKAAFEMFTSMFTPQTVMHSPMGRMCLAWYARFDTTVAMMGGFPMALSREWLSARLEYHQAQKLVNPHKLSCKIDERLSHWRLINYDQAILYAKGSRGQLGRRRFAEEHGKLRKQLLQWKQNWDPALTDPKYLVRDYVRRQPEDPDDIVDPYEVGILYQGPLLTTTALTAEYHAVMIMHQSSNPTLPPDEVHTELQAHAYHTCQCFEALEYWPNTPPGTLFSVQSAVTLASLFLPKDQRHQKWLRGKLAKIEASGFFTASKFRSMFAGLCQDQSVESWWFPNGEGLTPILRRVREFADERNAAAVTAQQEDLSEVKMLFSKMHLVEDDQVL